MCENEMIFKIVTIIDSEIFERKNFNAIIMKLIEKKLFEIIDE